MLDTLATYSGALLDPGATAMALLQHLGYSLRSGSVYDSHSVAPTCQLLQFAAQGKQWAEPSVSVHDPELDLAIQADMWALSPALPVASDYPLFVAYTSGTTGRPKGIVHCHGGYCYGVARTMQVVFDAPRSSDDAILTIGNMGWITGQSYMLHAPLIAGVRSILLEGSLIYPSKLRFAHVIASERALIGMFIETLEMFCIYRIQ